MAGDAFAGRREGDGVSPPSVFSRIEQPNAAVAPEIDLPIVRSSTNNASGLTVTSPVSPSMLSSTFCCTVGRAQDATAG